MKVNIFKWLINPLHKSPNLPLRFEKVLPIWQNKIVAQFYFLGWKALRWLLLPAFHDKSEFMLIF